jgi:hypothetical protein
MDQLAHIKGVGPTFLERHGEQVLALVRDAQPASERR